MKYIEVKFTMDDTGVYRDLLVDALGNEGPYESFVEEPDGLKAYVPQTEYDAGFLAATVQGFPIPLEYKVHEMEDRDWNAEWERNHEAALVRYDGGTVWVRAPFHPHRTDVDYEVVISPRMSFGTAHHPTTAMMLSYVAEMDIVGRRVLDMGCGTGVLGILAKMRGAEYVEGIDVDEWAFDNASDNAAANKVQLVLRQGDARLIDKSFDIALANINRNILLADMERYAAALTAGGRLVMSGFYDADEEALTSAATALGLHSQSKKNNNHWSALEFVK